MSIKSISSKNYSNHFTTKYNNLDSNIDDDDKTRFRHHCFSNKTTYKYLDLEPNRTFSLLDGPIHNNSRSDSNLRKGRVLCTLTSANVPKKNYILP